MRNLIIGLLFVPVLVYAQAPGTGSFKRSGGETVSVGGASSGGNLRGAQTQSGGPGGLPDMGPLGNMVAGNTQNLEARRKFAREMQERELAIKEAAAKQEQRKADQEFRPREAQIRQQGQR